MTINTAFESQSVDESRFYAIQSHLIDCDFSDHLPVVYLDTRNIAAECTVEWGWTMRHPSHRVILIWYFSWTHTHHILLHLSNKKSVTWPYHQNVRNFTLSGVTTWNFWAPKVFFVVLEVLGMTRFNNLDVQVDFMSKIIRSCSGGWLALSKYL